MTHPTVSWRRDRARIHRAACVLRLPRLHTPAVLLNRRKFEKVGPSRDRPQPKRASEVRQSATDGMGASPSKSGGQLSADEANAMFAKLASGACNAGYLHVLRVVDVIDMPGRVWAFRNSK